MAKKSVTKSPKEAPSSLERKLEPVINSPMRIFATFLIAGIAIYYRLQPMWKTTENSDIMAMWNSTVGTSGVLQELKCAETASEFDGCEPVRCGRYVLDRLVSKEEARQLIGMAEKGMKFGGSSGGATILDLYSGALSVGNKFADIRLLVKNEGMEQLFSYDEVKLFKSIKNRIQVEIEQKWKLTPGKLRLTKPVFFSRLTDKPATTMNDEYWHVHSDTEQYDRFHYTSLIYLNTYTTDFEGGRFMFDSPSLNHTVHPRAGRVSVFTSGTENPHHVERVTKGTRYAITIPFTCDPEFAIPDPVI